MAGSTYSRDSSTKNATNAETSVVEPIGTAMENVKETMRTTILVISKTDTIHQRNRVHYRTRRRRNYVNYGRNENVKSPKP